MRTEQVGASFRPFRGLSAFLWTEVLVQAHEELAMAASMLVQSVLLVFVYILAPSLLGIAFVGAIIYSMFTMGNRVLNEAAYVRIDHKANALYLAGPMSPEAYFVGMAFGILVVYVAPVVVLGALASVVVHFSWSQGLLLFALAATVWVFSASVGYVFSTFFRDNRAIWAYSSLFFNIFGVLPPVFYPFRLWPSALAPVALLMPPSAAAALAQASLGFTSLSTGETALAAGGLVAETVVVFLFAVWWARWTVRER